MARAGWATIDITPPPGLPLGGRGPRFTPGATILDQLCAQALLLEDAKNERTLWLSFDLIGLSRPFANHLRQLLAATLDVPYAAVVLCASHTHSGPLTVYDEYATDQPKPAALQAYEDDLAQKLFFVAQQALNRLQPVSVTQHRGASHIGVNRRRGNEAGEMAMAPNPEAPTIPDLWVLDLQAETSEERCIVFSMGCHPVIVYGYAWDTVSAEFPGVARRQLVSTLGGRVHCQFIHLEQGLFRPATPADPLAVGAQLAQDTLRALAEGGEQLTLDLAAASGWLHARRDPSATPPPAHWQNLAVPSDRVSFKQEDELNHNLSQYWSHRLQHGPPITQATPWEVGLLRLAPGHTIAWFADEAVVEWLGHLRNWLNDDRLVAWSYCQYCTGYLPTDELLPEGGYEVNSSNWYGKWGPGPFAPGLNEAGRHSFQALQRAIMDAGWGGESSPQYGRSPTPSPA
jgi:neutral ceramidase